MPAIKLEKLISVSSEDPSFKAENLLSNKKWRSNEVGESQVSVVFQLSKSSVIKSIDIGNNGSAFIEVLVSRLANTGEFKTILVASSFLSPIESRNGSNFTRVRMFTEDKLNTEVAKEKWDIVKIICTQPFNKTIKYGLSFITIHSPEARSEEIMTPKNKNNTAKPGGLKLGAFKLKDEDDSDDNIGSLFNMDKKNNLNNSVAADLRSDTTLASLAFQSEAASRKRKITTPPKVDISKPSVQNEIISRTKKPKYSPINQQAKLPRRNTINPGEDNPDEPEKEMKKNVVKQNVMKKEPKSETKVKKPSKKPEETSTSVKKVPMGKPFNKLMSDVVFVISGIQNPLRSDIRQKALAMGARYKGDWDSTCTHLVCAFLNTPKFNQVKGQGKIVKKDWIEQCHSKRKKFPWRRFCLDNNDKGTESEEEIWDETMIPSTSQTSNENSNKNEVAKVSRIDDDDDYDKDTDDELNELREAEKNKNMKPDIEIQKNLVKPSVAEDVVKNEVIDPYDVDTDDELNELREAQKRGKVSKPTLPAKTSVADMYGEETDEEDEKPDMEIKQNFVKTVENVVKKEVIDPYDVDTDIDDVDSDSNEKNGESLLPEYFSGLNFFMYGTFSGELRKSIIRGIVAGGGKVKDYMQSEVDFVVTLSEWDDNFKDARNVNAKVLFVHPSFIQDCFKEDQLVNTQKYLVTEK